MEVDLSNISAPLRQKIDDIFRRDHDLKVLKAIERQTQTAVVRRDAVRWHADLCPRYEIDPFVDTLWRHYYGHNYSENADLMRFLANRNPEIVTRARSPKIQVGYRKPEDRRQRTEGGNKRGCRFTPGTLKLAA